MRALLVTWIAAALVTLGLSAQAEGAYPGQNGRIVYVRTPGGLPPDSTRRLMVLDPTTGIARNLRGSVSAPAASPAGARIAYVCGSHEIDEPAISHICVVNTDGTAKRRLTHGSGYDLAPSFSRDGGRIAFVRRIDGRTRVTVMRGDGSRPRGIPGTTGAESTAFRPVGRGLLFTRDDIVYSIRSDGTALRRITRAGATAPVDLRAISPDGRRSVFVRWGQGLFAGTLYTAAIDGTDARPVPGSPSNAGSSPAFSPDGLSIVFGRRYAAPNGGSYDEARTAIWAIDVDGGNLRLVKRGRAGYGASQFDWQPLVLGAQASAR
ncbi:MAG: TolB family protein [Thermoleophilaceae bacterium]